MASVEQRPVKSDVLEAAADVGRAGRHETRLGKSDLGQKLYDLSAQISDAARGEVRPGSSQNRGTRFPPSDTLLK